ncbi:MAG TPA: cardiolipin synthase ClsB [Burkholderiaceae bacterium]|nr:cardiolipin synthase ClsB [Burkholderiaceae bacterium]
MTQRARPVRRRPRLPITTRPLIYGGNRLQLLEGGEQLFPRLIAAIETAQHSVRLETYIFAEDNVGLRVADALAAAAGRGVAVQVVVDAFGTGPWALELRARLEAAGAHLVVFRPAQWWRLERRLLRRLHRKLTLVDERVAFVGGINIIDDHHYPDADPVPGPRFDFAVQCEGPVVAPIALAMRKLWRSLEPLRVASVARADLQPVEMPPPFTDGVRAAFLLRDNLRNRRTIEDAYLEAIRAARFKVVLASAYFFPGRAFRRALVDCARRGVRVSLLVQGRVEYALQHYAQEALYSRLLDAGIEIHEYDSSYLHAKVALVDDAWATVGSSNIDPYSLLLAREANVVVLDARFAQALAAALQRAIERHSRPLRAADFAERSLLRRLVNWVAYRLVRFGAIALAGGRDY